jgi:hypothetical protein
MKKLKYTFTQFCETFEIEIVCFIGLDYEDILKEVNKKLYNNEFKECIKKDGTLEKYIEKDLGFFTHYKDKGFMTLWMKEYKDEWDFYEILLHELHHGVHIISESRGFMDEMEAKAYLFQYLFREIRRKIQNKELKNAKVSKLSKRKKGIRKKRK